MKTNHITHIINNILPKEVKSIDANCPTCDNEDCTASNAYNLALADCRAKLPEILDYVYAELRKEVQAKQEKWAEIEHKRWVKWQKYLHSRLYPLGESNLSLNSHLLVMPTELYQRWERQINAQYADLSEKEKESDREQVKPYIDEVLSLLSTNQK